MKTGRIQKKSWVTSFIGLGCLVLGVGVAWLLSKDSQLQQLPQQEETASTENTLTEEKATRETLSPFVETMIFERTQTSVSQSAILEIKIINDGEYHIKECISGEILSKGVWGYDSDTEKITLTHVGEYPMQNVFLVKEHQDVVHEMENTQLSSTDCEEPKWELVFIASESTNIRYELLGDGDVFAQQVINTPDKIQLNNQDVDAKGVF